MRKLYEGVYQLNLPVAQPIHQVYAYLILADKITLIDVGVSTEVCRETLQVQLAEIGLKIADIDQIVLTHHHYDHWSGICWFSKDIPIYLHHRFYEVSQIEGSDPNKMAQMLNDFVYQVGLPKNYSGDCLQIFKVASYHLPFSNLHIVREGDVIPYTNGLYVIEVPGHATTQIALISPTLNLAFSADVLIYNQNLSVWMEQKLPTDCSRPKFMLAYLDTLQKLRKKNLSKLYPGHGEDITDIEGQIIQRLLHIEKKKEQILKKIDASTSQTAWEIYTRLYSKRFIERFFTLTFAETFGVLDLLVLEGKIEMDEMKTPFQIRKRVDQL